MKGICLWKAMLMVTVLFNICVSGYMLYYFHKSLRNLKKTLTKLQINERRRTNGIGMTELMICLNLQILITYLIGAFFLVFWLVDSTVISVIVGLVPTLITGLTLKKMLIVINKVQNNA